VTFTETLPTGLTFSSVASTQGTCIGAVTITCYLGTLASGRSATVTIGVLADRPATYATTATVTEEYGTVHSASLAIGVLRNSPPQLSVVGGAFAPPLQARRVHKGAVVTTAFTVDEPATIQLRVVRAKGALPLLRGSSIATTIAPSKTHELSAGVAAGTTALHLRLNGAALRPGVTYRIVLTATDDQNLSSTLTIPFTAARG
jgi:hypothetical protein